MAAIEIMVAIIIFNSDVDRDAASNRVEAVAAKEDALTSETRAHRREQLLLRAWLEPSLISPTLIELADSQ